VGTTASGKSAIALELAAAFGDVEIVSADAMQVYRGMDIGTAKPTMTERAAVPHHLIDVVTPDEEYSIAQFQRDARHAIAGIEERGHRALLVGGSGLYVQAVVDDLDVPGRFPETLIELEGEADDVLYARLQHLDATAAARILPTNRRRILRALEVTIGSGQPFSSFGPGLGAHRPTRFRLAGVWLPRPVVGERIEHRYEEQLEAGFLEEVKALDAAPAGLSRTATQALGYRDLLAHLRGETTIDEAIAEAIRRTRAFARRQRVWFRRDPRIAWYAAAVNPFAALPALLGDWAR
jgi:tRNA dimethylallyltransferase